MTPKEKAKKLVEKYANVNGVYGASKRCALIAVDEMILVLPFTNSHNSLNEYAIQMQKYLEQVRHEIEKL